MINLNTERGLIKVETFTEIKEIPGFLENLAPTEHIMDDVIGNYNFKAKTKCGLSTCHTPHNKGFIIKTTDGHITNIGHICGKKHFNITFETSVKTFEKIVDERDNRETIQAFKAKIPILLKTFTLLKEQDRGIKWADTSAKIFSSPAKLPRPILKKLEDLKRSPKAEITIVRKMSEKETEIELERRNITRNFEEDTPPPVMYKEETVGRLEGIEILDEANKFRKILVNDLEPKTHEASTINEDLLTHKELKEWAKWISGVDSKVKELNRLLALARKFFLEKNLEQLVNYATEQEEETILRDAIRSVI